MSETDDWTEIKIATPLPMDVAATLMQLIGTAYPSAVISTANNSAWGREYALVMKVDPKERAKKVTKKQATELKQEVDPDADTDFIGFEDGWVQLATPEEIGLHLGELAHEMFTKTEGAINYVEWQVHTKDEQGAREHRYVLSVAKSKEQTPDALRKKAEARVAELEAQLAALTTPALEANE